MECGMCSSIGPNIYDQKLEAVASFQSSISQLNVNDNSLILLQPHSKLLHDAGARARVRAVNC